MVGSWSYNKEDTRGAHTMTPIHEQGIDAGDDKLKIPREISCAGMNDQNKGVPLVLIINNLRVSGNFETGNQEIHKRLSLVPSP
jgi:hypothetical protein